MPNSLTRGNIVGNYDFGWKRSGGIAVKEWVKLATTYDLSTIRGIDCMRIYCVEHGKFPLFGVPVTPTSVYELCAMCYMQSFYEQ